MRSFIPHIFSKRRMSQSGISLVEIVVGSAIITTGILSLLGAYLLYTQYALSGERNVQAAYLAEEGLEVMTFIRDESWSRNFGVFSTSTEYSILWTGTSWATTTVPQYVDGVFLRTFTVADVFRDSSNDRISTTSGSYDPDIKKVTVSVSYFQGKGTTTRTMATYLTNLYDN